MLEVIFEDVPAFMKEVAAGIDDSFGGVGDSLWRRESGRDDVLNVATLA